MTASSFPPEQPTDPDTRRSKVALLDVYDIAKRGVDLGMQNAQRLDVMHHKLDRALSPISFPRVPLWGIVVALMLVAGSVFVLSCEVRGAVHAAIAR